MTYSEISINKNTPIPLYYQLKQGLLKLIENGTLHPGDCLPTEAEFNQMFNVSRTTTRQAIMELVQEGYLYRVKGKGTFVSSPKLTQDFMQRLEPFSEQMKRLNVTTFTKILEFSTASAPEAVAEVFGLRPGDEAIHLLRLRYADDDPLVVVDTYLPISCEYLLGVDIASNGLYKSLSLQTSTRVVRVKREIEATLASAPIAKLLEVAPKSAVQKTTTIGYNLFDTPIEYSVAHYRGDKNKFQVELAVDVT